LATLVAKHSLTAECAENAEKKIIVVGAGMAGLAAAYELLCAGHDPLILEAQQRVGGRVYTLREPLSFVVSSYDKRDLPHSCGE
jgi:monoamine oxidase